MKIFRLNSDNLEELKTRGKDQYFKNEKEIQTLVERNLSELFTDLIFLKTEYQIEDLRIDTVAFDKERKSFAILEYKNKTDEDVFAQGITYHELLMDKKGEFVLLYNKINKDDFDLNDIEWDETRIIFIAPKFTKYQLRASGYRGLPTELYEIKKYNDDVVTLNRIDLKSKKTETKRGPSKTRPRFTLAEYNEKDYLAGKYETTSASPYTIELWKLFKNMILDAFSKLEFKQMKKYAGFYSTDDNSCVCTIDAQKNAIWLSYAITKKQFFENTDFVTYTTKGHFGVGHYRSKIKNSNDAERAIPFIQMVYDDKVGS